MQLSLPTPCHEDWQQMTATEKGKFCAACQKEVLDFSQQDLPEIKHFFDQQMGSTCGRFRVAQLEAFNVRYQPLPTPSLIRKWAAAAVLTAVVAVPSFAQQELPHSTPDASVTLAIDQANEDNSSSTSTEIVLSGKALDVENGEGLPFANVVWADKEGKTLTSVQTDFDGNFRLTTPPSEEVHLLIVSYVGYPTVQNELVPNQSRRQLVVELKGDTLEEGWLIGIVASYPAKPEISSRATRKERRKHKRLLRQSKRLERKFLQQGDYLGD